MTMKIASRLWLPALVLGGIVLLMSGTVGLRTSGQIALSDDLLRDQEARLQDATTWQGLTNTNAVRATTGAEIDSRRNDEIGAVQQSLAAMRDALRGIVDQVRESAESIQLVSAEVASGNTSARPTPPARSRP